MTDKNMKSTTKCRSSFSLTFALTTILFLSMFGISPAFAVDTPEIYLVSSPITPSLEWNVTAWVRGLPTVNATFAYQIALFFNTSFFECVRSWIPKSDEAWVFSGLNTVSPAPTIDNIDGFVLAGDSILIDTSVSGYGPFSLAVFKFHIKSQLELDPISYVNISNPDTYLLNDALEEISLVIKMNACGNSVWSSTSINTHSSQIADITDIQKHFGNGSFELIVGLDERVPNSFAQLTSLTSNSGVEVVGAISKGNEITAAVVKLDLKSLSSFQAQLTISGFSTYVEPNYEFKACMTSNDPYWDD